MAKVTGKVLRTFRDKHTGTRHIQGESIEVASQARLDEINSKFTYVEAEEEKPKAARASRTAPDASESETKND